MRIRSVSLPLCDAVHIEHAPSHVERIAGNSDQPLHQSGRGVVSERIFISLKRRDEHHDITATRLSVSGKVRVRKRYVSSKDCLVDEEPVADEQRRDHAARWNAVSLDEERPQDEEDRQRADDRLEIFPEIAKPGPLRNGARLLSAPRVRRSCQGA